MLKLRSIGLNDYSVLEGRQRIGRIRMATERMPCVWLWAVTIHLTGGLPTGVSYKHPAGGGSPDEATLFAACVAIAP